MTEFLTNLKAEQQKKVLLGRMKLEDASKTAELTADQNKLEETLAKLNALDSKQSKLKMQMSSATRGKGRLQRMSTTLHVDDPVANDAIKSAMADLSQTEGGRAAVVELLKSHKGHKTSA